MRNAHNHLDDKTTGIIFIWLVLNHFISEYSTIFVQSLKKENIIVSVTVGLA